MIGSKDRGKTHSSSTNNTVVQEGKRTGDIGMFWQNGFAFQIGRIDSSKKCRTFFNYISATKTSHALLIFFTSSRGYRRLPSSELYMSLVT